MNWFVRRPRVYRYLESAYVDEFFSTGRLMLSSFSRFAEHTDEHRFDSKEGNSYLIHRTTDKGGQTLLVEMDFGHDAYVLCGSLLPSIDLMNEFKANSAIVIKDPIGFVTSIARALEGFRMGVDGPCSYQFRRIIEHDLGWIDLGPTVETEDIKNFNIPVLQSTLKKMITQDVYFLKNTKYVSQAEWRFVWLMNHDVDKNIVIEVPEARKFCVPWDSQGEVIAFDRRCE